MLFVITENKPNNKIIEKLAPFIDTFEVVFAESLKELIEYKVVSNGDYVLFASDVEQKPTKTILKTLPFGAQVLTLTSDSVGEDLDLSQLFIRLKSKPRIGAFLKSPEKLLYQPVFKENNIKENKDNKVLSKEVKKNKKTNDLSELKSKNFKQKQDKKDTFYVETPSVGNNEVVEPVSNSIDVVTKEQGSQIQEKNKGGKQVQFEKRTRTPRGTKNGEDERSFNKPKKQIDGQSQSLKSENDRPKNNQPKQKFNQTETKKEDGFQNKKIQKVVRKNNDNLNQQENKVVKVDQEKQNPFNVSGSVQHTPVQPLKEHTETKTPVSEMVNFQPFEFEPTPVTAKESVEKSPFSLADNSPFELGSIGNNVVEKVTEVAQNVGGDTFESLMAKMGGQ